MLHVNPLVGPLLQLIPRPAFDDSVDSHNQQGPKPRAFSSWFPLVAMLVGQLSTARVWGTCGLVSIDKQAVFIRIWDRVDRLSPLGLAQIEKPGGLGTAGTGRSGPKCAEAALPSPGLAFIKTTI
jgi:hypothetical protein